MPALRSSNLSSCSDYNKETQSFSITFKSGSVYTYSDVPETVYEGLLSAPSAGSYFAANIKDQFSFVKG